MRGRPKHHVLPKLGRLFGGTISTNIVGTINSESTIRYSEIIVKREVLYVLLPVVLSEVVLAVLYVELTGGVFFIFGTIVSSIITRLGSNIATIVSSIITRLGSNIATIAHTSKTHESLIVA